MDAVNLINPITETGSKVVVVEVGVEDAPTNRTTTYNNHQSGGIRLGRHLNGIFHQLPFPTAPVHRPQNHNTSFAIILGTNLYNYVASHTPPNIE